MCPWFDSWRNHKPPNKAVFYFIIFFLRLVRFNKIYYFCTTLKQQSKTTYHGFLAQLVEQWIENPCVPGSIPGETTNRLNRAVFIIFTSHTFIPREFIVKLLFWAGCDLKLDFKAEADGQRPITIKLKNILYNFNKRLILLLLLQE
jgi:hypothetical protein